MLAVELRPEETRGPFQDLIRPSQLTNLLLELTDPRCLAGGDTGLMAVVDVGLVPHNRTDSTP
jgi:hypothetical protein